MSFLEIVGRAKAHLREQGRVSLRALRREFDLDDESLEELVEELVDLQQVAVREGQVLSWVGPAPSETSAPEPEARPAPRTPPEVAAAPPAAEPEAQPVARAPSERAAGPPTAKGEHRHLTVMFCRLVGSTALGERLDPEDLHGLIRDYQQMCAAVFDRCGGRIATYSGDGLLVYFGYPQAHEDDAERAVRAGLGVLGELERLNERFEPSYGARISVRMSVHSGPVVVGELGGSEAGGEQILGHTMNLAEGLEGVAEPDTLVISTETLRLVQGIFRTRDLGVRSLKGVAEPVRIHQVMAAAGMRSRLDTEAATGLTPLVGRDQELGLLDDRWAQVREGWGQAMLLCGEAGIGKSRLMQAFRERLAEHAHTWLECRCSPYTQESALQPVLELQRQALGFRVEEAAERKLPRLQAGLEAVGFDPAQTLPLMAGFHSLKLPEGYEEPVLGPEGRRKQTLELLTEWVLRLGREQPLVLLMEDLHWVDPSTLELLGMVLDQVARAPVLLLLTYRPAFQPPWGARSHLTPVLLARLTRAQMGDLVRKAARERDLPEAWVGEIVRRADGVPLFGEELTRTVVASNFGPPRGGKTPALQIPETLQDLLMARLDALGPVKELAQLGSVLGREFSYDLLLAVSPLREERLREALAEAVQEELFYQRGSPPQSTYLFKHTLVGDVAYRSLLRSTRRRHHLRVAETLVERMPQVAEEQPELVAHHLTEAGEGDRAIDYWQQAGERANAQVAHEEARSHWLQVRRLLADLEDSPRKLFLELLACGRLALLSWLLGAPSDEIEALFAEGKALAERLPDPRPQTLLQMGYAGYVGLSDGDITRCVSAQRESVRLAELSGDPVHRLAARGALAQALNLAGKPAESLELLDRCIAERPEDPLAGREISGISMWIYAEIERFRALGPLGRLDECDEALGRGIELAREHGDLQLLSLGLSARVIHGEWSGETTTTLADARQSAEIAERTGVPLFLSTALACLGDALRLEGRHAEALGAYQRALDLMRAKRVAAMRRPHAVSGQALSYSALGEHERAIARARSALEESATRGNRLIEDLARLNLARVLLATGDPHLHDEIERTVERAEALSEETGMRVHRPCLLEVTAALAERRGSPQEARERLREAHRLYTEMGAAGHAERLARELGP
jgi:class 3 adenylate cyclase/tetratricopeptide (TPR) repeat protein